MKTFNSIRQYLPVIIFSLALMAASGEVSAQNHRNNKSHKNNDHNEYRNDRSVRNNDRKSENKWREKDGRNYEYSKGYSKKHNYSHNNYFTHPKYGRVYQRFDHNPIVFRHSHGNYYYSGNNFYSYRKGVGYCVVEPPRNVYFRDLPFRCERVYVHGQAFYRNGDLFFNYSPRGYVIVPSPFEVSFSVKF